MGWHYVYISQLQRHLRLKNTVSRYSLRLVVNAVGPSYPSSLILNYEMWCVICATRTTEQRWKAYEEFVIKWTARHCIVRPASHLQ